MDIYLGITIYSTDEILMALLMQYEFESYEEYDDHFIAYIRKDAFPEGALTDIENVIRKFTSKFNVEEIQPQNWNAIWEESFQPVCVDDFCLVRADFHQAVEGIKYDLIINPKMAFGTGHHATTHMMISMMQSVDMLDKSVFDFGCGTGILAILASKMGAKNIDAIDIEHESFLNTQENAQINDVANLSVFEGDLENAPRKTYDIILANINRNILIKYADELSSQLAQDGNLLLSGVLVEDEDFIVQPYAKLGLQVQDKKSQDGWICLHMTKSKVILGLD